MSIFNIKDNGDFISFEVCHNQAESDSIAYLNIRKKDVVSYSFEKFRDVTANHFEIHTIIDKWSYSQEFYEQDLEEFYNIFDSILIKNSKEKVLQKEEEIVI